MTGPPTVWERDYHGDYLVEWMVSPPPVGTCYRVLEETWSPDSIPPVRRIWAYEVPGQEAVR